VTHVYARQLIDGLEVSDGDINVNIDRHGRVLSWGNSFVPNPANAASLAPKPNELRRQRAAMCEQLDAYLDAHQDALDATEGPSAWEMVKEAAKAWFGIIPEDEDEDASAESPEAIRASMRKIRDEFRTRCEILPESDAPLKPAEALSFLLARISDSHEGKMIDPAAIESTPHHHLKPQPAYNEPPTEILSSTQFAALGVVSDVPARLMYTQTDGHPTLVYQFEVEMNDNWYEAYVSPHTGDIIRIVDWASDFHSFDLAADKGGKQKPFPKPADPEYFVFPWGVNDPTTGKTELVKNPADKVASPLGWHTFPTSSNAWPSTKFKGQYKDGDNTVIASTVGNNVLAHEDWEGRDNFLDNWRPVNESFSFVYEYGEPDGLAPKEYIDFVTTQLFYTCNMYHDLLHRLGFDEVSGNFQMSNFKNGGLGGDPVIANAQDGSGYNNANFMTPPDGRAPRMRMYIWDTATPYRDGDLEAGIVIHEYSHGLSTRLTGGPANSGCLGWGEAGGMGEGWGDAIATIIRQVIEHKNFHDGKDVYPMGAWAANQPGGIRNFIYSTNSTTNPSTYKTLDRPGYWGVHAIGEVWAEILFVLTQRLIEKYGFSDTLFPPEDVTEPNDYYASPQSFDSAGRALPLVPKHGNTLSLQLIISAMKLQPCRPTFFNARDAIIAADKALTDGANECIIWKAFAERGLGSDARIDGQTPWGGGVRKDGYKIPASVCK
jgi:extracellular elastinolytic metalloproteinase